MDAMDRAEANVATVQLLVELTHLTRKGLLDYVLPAVPVGSGFVVGFKDGPQRLEPEQVDRLVLAAMQAGVYP
jgi:hypothetical protein